jgi:hypothetical protein
MSNYAREQVERARMRDNPNACRKKFPTGETPHVHDCYKLKGHPPPHKCECGVEWE